MNRSYVLIASSHLSHQKSASTLLRAGHATQRLSLPAPSSSPRSAAAMAPAKSPARRPRSGCGRADVHLLLARGQRPHELQPALVHLERLGVAADRLEQHRSRVERSRHDRRPAQALGQLERAVGDEERLLLRRHGRLDPIDEERLGDQEPSLRQDRPGLPGLDQARLDLGGHALALRRRHQRALPPGREVDPLPPQARGVLRPELRGDAQLERVEVGGAGVVEMLGHPVRVAGRLGRQRALVVGVGELPRKHGISQGQTVRLDASRLLRRLEEHAHGRRAGGRLAERRRGGVVPGDGLTAGLGHPLELLRQEQVQAGALAARDRLVRHVADQRVLEAVAAAAAMVDEVAIDEVPQPAGRATPAAVQERLELLEREAPPDHGRPLEEQLVLGVEQVEPGRDHALHRLGHAVAAAALAAHRQDLLEEERVPAGQVDDARRRVGRRRRARSPAGASRPGRAPRASRSSRFACPSPSRGGSRRARRARRTPRRAARARLPPPPRRSARAAPARPSARPR